jgi:hopanoid biosynthesis associated radical SAM protein HpnH
MRFPWKLNLSMACYFAGKALEKEERFPLVLMLEPLHACNLSCRGCGRIREYRESLDRQLTAESCIESAIECGAPVVSISGGEPMLYKDIDRVVDVLLRLGRHVYLCTNGLKLEEFVERNEPHPNLFLNVHLDGQAERHDLLAGRPGVFRAATDAVWRAKRKGFTVTTNTTVFKTTGIEELARLFEYLQSLRVDGFFISPGFHYGALDAEDFLNREEVHEKFERVHDLSKRFRFYSTPLYLDFLRGKRSYRCAPWGTVTRNPQGWKAPCYLITDTHYPDYDTWLRSVDWEYYRSGQDPRCRQCMMHSGFEPAAVLAMKNRWKDIGTMLAWNLL